MTAFIFFDEEVTPLLTSIVSCHDLHAKWLNTLSYLENCGARKIAACEHPTLVKEEMLKHAAEEFRHAHHLKRQIEKIVPHSIETYQLNTLLGGYATLHYLSLLDLRISRYLHKRETCRKTIKEKSYLLVTYAIECRANELYTLYDRVLKKMNSKIAVKSILLEEKEHLNEMEEGLKQFSNGLEDGQQACFYESELCRQWLLSIKQQIRTY